MRDFVKNLNLFEPIHSGSIGLFRILFGIIMISEAMIMEDYFVKVLPESRFFMTYDFFHWVKMTSAENLKILLNCFYFACILFIAGVFYRFAALVIFLIWTYLFLLDIGHYNNHFYLFSLVSFVFIFLNADQSFSLKRWFSKNQSQVFIPKWQLLVLKYQILVVYVWGGLVKINWDWLNGYPIRAWAQELTTNTTVNSILSTEFSVYFISYFGILYDLFIVFILSSKYVWLKRVGVVGSFFFHLTNNYLFSIGMFPFFGLAALVLYFDPIWPKNLVERLKGKKRNQLAREIDIPMIKVGYFGGKGFLKPIFYTMTVIFVVYQGLYPLRPYLYEGNASWNGAGHRFSWRMLLQDREEAARFRLVIEEEGIDQYLDLYDKNYINNRQFKRMIRTPKQIKRFAFFISDIMKENGLKNQPKMYATIWKSLNNREVQPLIDTEYDLLAEPYNNWGQADFVLPFKDTKYKSIDSLYVFSEKELLDMSKK